MFFINLYNFKFQYKAYSKNNKVNITMQIKNNIVTIYYITNVHNMYYNARYCCRHATHWTVDIHLFPYPTFESLCDFLEDRVERAIYR